MFYSKGIINSLHNHDIADVRDSVFVEEIVSEVVFYGKFEQTYLKKISVYNKENRLVSEIGYDKNGKIQNRYFIY